MRRWPLLFVVVLFTCGDLREDELRCEEAVAHLDDCCNDFDPTQLSCRFLEGCSGTDDDLTLTDFSVAQSECITELSCSRIRLAGLCLLPSEDASGRAELLESASCPEAPQ